ncbi:GL20422 [Drosophila persimilis]|uniref:GL20422 n=1 Tax=Drosophila persimilis TaxID=7234 RepID=B4GY60_DROPE|nr:GL20422 [Drosophila persimilis]
MLLRLTLLATVWFCAAPAVLNGKELKRREAGLTHTDHPPRPAPQYGPPPQQQQQHVPHREYGVPQQIPFREYGPPALKYGPPKLNFLGGGGGGGGGGGSSLHEQIKTHFGVPKPFYGPPHIQHKPAPQYGPPKQQYGPPPPQPAPQYGPPPQPAPQYGPPPSPQYGPPPPLKIQHRPSPQYGPPKPQYGPPPPPQHLPSPALGAPVQARPPAGQLLWTARLGTLESAAQAPLRRPAAQLWTPTAAHLRCRDHSRRASTVCQRRRSSSHPAEDTMDSRDLVDPVDLVDRAAQADH